MNCIFCDIIERRSPAEIVFENEKAIAFLDIKPIHPGHTLVVPKQHFDQYVHIPPDYYHDVMTAIHHVTDSILKTYSPDGYNMFTSNGRAAGQSVFHVHFHVTPRYFNDKISFRLQLKSYLAGEMQSTAEKLRAHIPSI